MPLVDENGDKITKGLDMFKTTRLADAVYVVAFRASGVGGSLVRYEGWADRACVSRVYRGNLIMKNSDVAALRINLDSFISKSTSTKLTAKELWKNSTYVATFPSGVQLPGEFNFAGAGIPRFLDQYKTKGGVYLARSVDDVKPGTKNPVHHVRLPAPAAPDPSTIQRLRQEADTNYLAQLSTTLESTSKIVCVPPGMSGGPAMIGIDSRLVKAGVPDSYLHVDGHTTLAVACVVAELGNEDTRKAMGGNAVSSYALFGNDPSPNAGKANPLLLLCALGAHMDWHKYEYGSMKFLV